MNDRPQPSDVEAEKSVLGALLIENSGYAQISSQLETRHFFRDAHRRIYRAMAEMFDAGKPVDLRLLIGELERRGDLEEVGGPAYIAALVDGVPRSTNVKHYAEVVREKAALRELLKVGHGLVASSAAASDSAKKIIQDTETALTRVADSAKILAGVVSMSEAIREFDIDLARRVERKGQIDGWPTGFPGMDLYTHGWQPGQMVVIAGDTSYGKSILAANATLSIAQAGGRVVYYSYEMKRKALIGRMVSALSGVALTRMRWGQIAGDAEWEAIREARARLEQLPIEINDSGSRRIQDAHLECRRIKVERGLAAAVFDHFQLTENEDGENRTQQLGNTSRRIQELGAELDVTTFTLSQLTIDPKDAKREPQLHDLRDCKSLGHEADTVLMLHPYDVVEARKDVPVVPFKCLIRKNRGDSVGLVTLNLERDFVRFVEAEPPAPVVKEAKPKAAKPSDFTW